MTAVAAVTGARVPSATSRRIVAAATLVAFGLIDIFVFGLLGHKGDAAFAFSIEGAKLTIPVLHVQARPVAYALGIASVLIGVARGLVTAKPGLKRLSIGLVLLFFIVSLLLWSDSGSWVSGIPINVVVLLQTTLATSIPLILGALAGCMGERAGVINIAIEGQLLLGAFMAAIVASAVGALWLGLISGALGGALVGLVLAAFAVRYLVDQIILGVVLNLLISGLTGFFYDRLMVPNANTYNNGPTFSAIKIPGSATSRSWARSCSTRRSSCTSRTRRSFWFRSDCSTPGSACGCARSASTRPRPTPSASGCSGSATGT